MIDLRLCGQSEKCYHLKESIQKIGRIYVPFLEVEGQIVKQHW